MKPERTARYYWLKFIRLKGDPSTLARGVAVGLFVGVTPTIPLHTALVLFFSALFRGNIIAGLIASMAISNPLTWLPQYFFSWWIGSQFMPGHLSWERIKGLLNLLTSGASFQESIRAMGQLGFDAILVMVLGGVLLAVPFTAAGYLLSLRFFEKIRKKRQEKHILN